MILLGCCFMASVLRGARVRTLQNFQGNHKIRDLEYFLPHQEFYVSLNDTFQHMLKIIEPFDENKDLILIERLVADRYPFTSVVGISWYRKYDPSHFALDKKSLEKKGIVLLSTTVRETGAKGQVFHFRQTVFGKAYRKWVVYFGNHYQSAAITVVFPEDKRHSVGERLHRTVVHARFKHDK